LALAYGKESERFQNGELKEKGKVMRAIEQTYIYMTINRHRYGCLTTFNQTWFFRKEEDNSNPQQSKLFVSPAIECNSNQPYTLISSWL
jgi:hypothetical protein